MSIIKKPIITEKMSSIEEKLGRYGFIVSDKANKVEIKKAVEEAYGVTVKAVNTLRTARKSKRKFTANGVLQGTTSIQKKAIVTLAEGDVIDFYSNI